jgi:hypothetical protein
MNMLIDMCDERWLDHLTVAADGATKYLLIDGAFIPGIYRQFSAALPSAQTVTLLFETLPSCTDKTRDVSPFIAPYHASNKRVQSLLERCSGWPMISAIETAETPADLSARLAAWCVVEIADHRFNLRFPDTRRLPAIFDSLTMKQRSEFAGPATRWSYIDRGGRWAELNVPASLSAIADRPSLDDQQFARLVSESEVDEVISILRSRSNQMTQKYSEIYAVLEVALKAANRRNIDMALKVEWCESCLRGALLNDISEADGCLRTWLEQVENLTPNQGIPK